MSRRILVATTAIARHRRRRARSGRRPFRSIAVRRDAEPAAACRRTSISAKSPAWPPTRADVCTSTRGPAIRRSGLGNSRLFSHGGSRLLRVRRARRLHARDRPGRLCAAGRAQRPRRRAGQHLDRRRGIEPGRQVRSGGARAADPRPQARGDYHPHRLTAAAAAAPAAGRGGGTPGAGAAGDQFTRPSDVAWDAEGNIFVADGHGPNARIAKFDRDGRFLTSWGSRGSEPGQFAMPHSIAVDAQGNVYVADPGQQAHPGVRQRRHLQSRTIAQHRRAHRVVHLPRPAPIPLQLAHRRRLRHGRCGDLQAGVGRHGCRVRFGKAGKLAKELGLVNAIDCRVANTLYVGELSNWRVQKLTHPLSDGGRQSSSAAGIRRSAALRNSRHASRNDPGPGEKRWTALKAAPRRRSRIQCDPFRRHPSGWQDSTRLRGPARR